MNGGGEQKTDRFPAGQNQAVTPRSQGLVPFVKGLAVVVIAVAASLIAVSYAGGGKTQEAPSTTVLTIIKEVPVPTQIKGAVQVGTHSASPSSVLPSMESSSVAPTSTVNSTTSEPSSTASLPTTTSSEPTAVTVEQMPVETTTVEPPATQAEQP